MFKHILVPLDGSSLAEAALPAAVHLAGKLHAKITLIHVIEHNAPRAVHGQAHLKDNAEAGDYLRRTARDRFPDSSRVECHVHTAEVNNVAESIVAHAIELKNDLIIMCSHGRGRALHLMAGSIAQKVIGKGSIPVLITYPGENETPPAFSCRTVLAPLDGDPNHERALPVARGLAEACGAALQLVRVVPDFGSLSGPMTVTSRFLPGTTSKMLEISVENAEAYLRDQLTKLKEKGFTAGARVSRGDPANGIIECARQLNADVIVLGTHGRSGMEAFWAGSVAHKVCSRHEAPVLLAPLRGPEEY